MTSTDGEFRKWTAAELRALPLDARVQDKGGDIFAPAIREETGEIIEGGMHECAREPGCPPVRGWHVKTWRLARRKLRWIR